LAQIETTLIAQNQSLTSAETSNAVVDNSVGSLVCKCGGNGGWCGHFCCGTRRLYSFARAGNSERQDGGYNCRAVECGGENSASNISADQAMSAPTAAVNVPPSEFNPAAFNPVNTAAAQLNPALENPVIDSLAMNSVIASDNDGAKRRLYYRMRSGGFACERHQFYPDWVGGYCRNWQLWCDSKFFIVSVS
jgi:hypothetical protein